MTTGSRHLTTVEDPGIARFLFSDTRAGWIWLVLRIWLGWQWLSSGWGKFNNPAWMENGAALQSYWANAVRIPEQGRPAITFDWYRSFLQFLIDANAAPWFAKLIVFGEILVGIALIVGLLTGIAAFLGSVMNFNFLLAGSASTNPVMFAIAVFLVMAWKVAGYYGLDRWALPALGTPWQRGPLAGGDRVGRTESPIGGRSPSAT